MFPLYTNQKDRTTKHFLMFSAGKEGEDWPEMG